MNRSVTIWKSHGRLRCVLVPQPDWSYFQVQLIRGTEILDVAAEKTLDAVYAIARRWQAESHAPVHSISAAA